MQNLSEVRMTRGHIKRHNERLGNLQLAVQFVTELKELRRVGSAEDLHAKNKGLHSMESMHKGYYGHDSRDNFLSSCAQIGQTNAIRFE